MPIGYTEEELILIRKNLMTKGKVLFSKFGYKKIGVRELTREVGIANGMFYKFFKSKDELFYMILKKEQEVIRTKIFNEMLKYKEQPTKALKKFYYIIIDELNSNPLTQSIFNSGEYKDIYNKFSEDDLLKEKQQSISLYQELIEYWQDNNQLQNVDINIVIESLRSIVYLWFHKEEIGLDRYDTIIEFIINKVCTI